MRQELVGGQTRFQCECAQTSLTLTGGDEDAENNNVLSTIFGLGAL